MLNIKDAVYTVVDTETTGFSPTRDRIVELGIAWCDWEGKILADYCTRINPGMPIPPGATAVHGITDEDVEDAPTLAEVLTLWQASQPPGPKVLVSHNGAFDWAFLPEFSQGFDLRLCTLKLSRKLWPRASHKLQDLRAWLEIYPWLDAHSALDDAWVTAGLLSNMLALVHNTPPEEDVFVEQLIKWTQR